MGRCPVAMWFLSCSEWFPVCCYGEGFLHLLVSIIQVSLSMSFFNSCLVKPVKILHFKKQRHYLELRVKCEQ